MQKVDQHSMQLSHLKFNLNVQSLSFVGIFIDESVSYTITTLRSSCRGQGGNEVEERA